MIMLTLTPAQKRQLQIIADAGEAVVNEPLRIGGRRTLNLDGLSIAVVDRLFYGGMLYSCPEYNNGTLSKTRYMVTQRGLDALKSQAAPKTAPPPAPEPATASTPAPVPPPAATLPQWVVSYGNYWIRIGLIVVRLNWEPGGYEVVVSGAASGKLKNRIEDLETAKTAGLQTAKKFLMQSLGDVEALLGN